MVDSSYRAAVRLVTSQSAVIAPIILCSWKENINGTASCSATTRTPFGVPRLHWPKSTLHHNITSYKLALYLTPTSIPLSQTLLGPQMLDNIGKMTQPSGRCQTITPETPPTGYVSSPNNVDLASKLAATAGPIKNANEAKTYLEQRSLIVIGNNYRIETLANILITTSFEPKIPDKVNNIIRAVALLMVSKFQNNFTEDITAAVTEKLQNASDHMSNHLKKRAWLPSSGSNRPDKTNPTATQNCQHNWKIYAPTWNCHNQYLQNHEWVEGFLTGILLQFNLMRVEICELRSEVVTEGDDVLVHYRSRVNVWRRLSSKTLA